MRRLQAVLALARTQARDALRSPVAFVVLVLGASLTLAAPEVAIFTLGHAQAFILDLGASTVLLALLFLAAVTGALGTGERVQDGTATLVLARAVSPLEYVLGTFLGVASVLALGAWVLGLALVHATAPGGPGAGLADLVALGIALARGVRASRAGRSFQPAFLLVLAGTGTLAVLARVALGGLPALAGVAAASTALAFLAGLAYAALGVALGVRLPPVLAASATLGAAVVGAASEGLRGGAGEGFASALATVVPDLSLFSVVEAAYADHQAIALGYVLGVAGWTLAYTAGALALAAVLLGRKELGSGS